MIQELKLRLESYGLNLENYGKHQIHLVNAVRSLKVIFADYLKIDDRIDLILCLITLRNSSILLESNDIFLRNMEEWKKQLKKDKGLEP